MTPIEEALNEGYTQEEINSYLSQKTSEAKEAGYTDEEISQYIKENITQQPEFNKTAVASQGHRTLAARPAPKDVREAIATGWNWSSLGLATEAMNKGGHLPEMAVDSDTPWYLRAAANVAGLAGDVPAMIAGGILGGGPASPMTAVGGGFALPMGLRKVFQDALENNEIGSKKDFADRVAGTMWETAKGWMTGAATAGVGKAVTGMVSSSPTIVKSVVPTAAELGTLTTVSAALEGHAPEPQALLDNALVLGVAKAVLPNWTRAKPLTDIYVKTGKHPEEVTTDALRGDQGVWQDVLDGRIPDAYKHKVEQPSGQTQNQRAPQPKTGEAAQKLTPEQEAQARAFMGQPFAEIPQIPNEPSRPTHINYNRIQTTDEAKTALAQLSTIYEAKIKETQQSPRAWARSHEDAGKVLADLLQVEPKQAMAFLEGQTVGPSTTAQLLARKELTLGFTEDLMRSRAALMTKGDKATPEELAAFLAQVERVSNVHAAFLGQRADVGRALNALKSTQRQADKSQAILDAINQYGGEQNVAKLVEMLGEYDNPAQAIQFARKATKATTWEMMVEAWKAGLVSGFRTNEVNFLSTAAFTTLRLPTESIAAALGVVRRGEDKVALSEIPARAIGMLTGVRDGIKVAGAMLRTGDNATSAKTDTFQPKIPGKVGEVVRLPFRFLSASDMLFKTINERGELYALAVKQAIKEGKETGGQSFFSRVAEIAANPTDAMQAQAKDAALRYTFNKPLGPGGQSFARTVKEWHLEWLFPFVTTPGNIFKETARMTPGLNFAVKEWRQAWEQGGAARDKAMAEVAVGTALMSAVIAAVNDGIITGNGTPDKRVRATQHAAGWKPYAVKINGEYIDGYLRMAPIGPLIGIAADSAEFWNYMSDGERDQWARMLAFAFAQNVTNQTFMSGMTNFANVLQDPTRYGENYVEAIAGSVVPGILAQTAQEMDPLMREIHGMRDAMMARIPLMREGFLPKRDLWGEPIPNPERLWWGSPFSTTPLSSDKVRTEAARIGFAAPMQPKKIDVVPGASLMGTDMVELTPEQKDVFASTAGQMAYQIMSGMVHAEGWDTQPDIIKRQMYEKAFKHSRDYAQKQVLLGLDPSVQQGAVAEFQRQLTQ